MFRAPAAAVVRVAECAASGGGDVQMKGIGRWVRHVRAFAVARLRGDAAGAERERREIALLALDRDADWISFRRDGLVWTTRAVRHTITRNLYVHGRHPRTEVAALRSWLAARGRLGDAHPWCVDVGANVGAPTLFFARDLGRRVVAVEPVPDNLSLLRRNVRQNGMGRSVRVVFAAVAAEPGALTVMRAPKDGESEVAADGGASGERVTVRARRLDEILAAEGVAPADVSFVWSDTQGFETQVLRSAPSLWAAGVPAFVEMWPEALGRHGGVPAFVDTCASAFRTFVTSRDLVERGAAAPERPIRDLGAFLGGLRKQTDGLLVP